MYSFIGDLRIHITSNAPSYTSHPFPLTSLLLAPQPPSRIRTYLYAQGALPEPLFSVFFDINNFQANSGGEIVFGGVNSNHFTGTHVFASLTSTTYWQFSVASIAVGSASGEETAGCREEKSVMGSWQKEW